MLKHPRPLNPPHIFHLSERRSESLEVNYIPTQNEENPDTNQNYDGDSTYEPQFVGPPGSFNNGVVQNDLGDAGTMWYRMYLEVIRGVMRLDKEVPQGKNSEQSCAAPEK